jgi:hypothetical protein
MVYDTKIVKAKIEIQVVDQESTDRCDQDRTRVYQPGNERLSARGFHICEKWEVIGWPVA